MNQINNNSNFKYNFLQSHPRKIGKVNINEEKNNCKLLKEDKDEKIKNLEKSLSEKENELEKTKVDLNNYYKLYLEYKNQKNQKNIDAITLEKYNNIEKRNKELFDENSQTKKDLKEKDLTLKAISEQYSNLLNKNKALESQKEIISQKIKGLEQNNNDLLDQNKKIQDSNVSLNNTILRLQKDLEQKRIALAEITSNNKKLNEKN